MAIFILKFTKNHNFKVNFCLINTLLSLNNLLNQAQAKQQKKPNN